MISHAQITDDKCLDAIIRWIEHDPEHRQGAAPGLLKHVRVPNLSWDYISSLTKAKERWLVLPWLNEFLMNAAMSRWQNNCRRDVG